MKTLKNMLVLFVGLLFIQVTVAQDFIEAKDLVKILKDKNTVLVSAQKAGSYNDFHITGSISLAPSILTTNEPIKYTLKSVDEMAKIIGDKGVSANNLIVVYDEGSSKYSGRLYWNLKYLGAENVKILNGGLEAWQAIRKPVTTTPTKLKATVFTAKVQPQFLATHDEVKKATTSANYVIIDARSAKEYNGTDKTKLRLGHIPNAVHIEYKDIIAANGKLKTAEELKAIYTAKGVTPDKTVIIYCKTSVRAAIEFAALNSILGYKNVKVYDGAFTEWSSDSSTEVVL